jgi:Xaa-Pro dipeptidase
MPSETEGTPRRKAQRRFTAEEYAARVARVRAVMAERGLDACLITSPENVYYLCGLDHMGYFAFSPLLLPREGTPILVTRGMERAVVRDQTPDVIHVGYADGLEPPPDVRSLDEPPAAGGGGEPASFDPSMMSVGVPTRRPAGSPAMLASVRATVRAIEDAGLGGARIALEKSSSFFPLVIAEGILAGLPHATWEDASGIVDDCRIVQSPSELALTRRAAAISDSMMLAAIAAAGPGVNKREIMAAIYDAMFRRGGTYPGFVPLVRSTGTLEHEHGTWEDRELHPRDLLFLEMAGCVRRYHAPIGRLVYIGKPPAKAARMHELCRRAEEAAARRIGPGVAASEVYRTWQSEIERGGLHGYRRHHCGYAVGIGYPPSWSGSGVPVGLRPDSSMELRPGMVFHLMSWLLRTPHGDSFLSDTIAVTESGCELLTSASRELTVR